MGSEFSHGFYISLHFFTVIHVNFLLCRGDGVDVGAGVAFNFTMDERFIKSLVITLIFYVITKMNEDISRRE